MSDVITALSWINDVIFVSLVNTILQMTILISVVALFIWIFRIRTPTMRYSLWLFVLFGVIVLPLLTPFVSQIDFARFRRQWVTGDGTGGRPMMESTYTGELSEAVGSLPSKSAANAAVSREMDVSLINPVSIAYFIWCAVMLFMLCVTVVAHIKLRKLRMCSPDVKDSAALEMLSQLKHRIGVRKSVGLKASSEIYTPMSLGIFSAVMIVPNSLMDDDSRDELEMILAHELAHIRRYDYLVNMLQNTMRAIFFFHPLFHLMNRSLTKEREHICDDWVIDITNQRNQYAQCIVGLLERVVYRPVNIPVTMAMAERKKDIPGRIDMIVDRTRKIATKVPRKSLLALLLIGCLSLPVLGGTGLVRFAGARAEDRGRIVFSSFTHEEGFDIYVMDADGSNVTRLTHGAEGYEPVWSPDGKKIAFTCLLHETPVHEIYVIDADGSNMKRLTNTLSKYGSRSPSWSPDGEKILFASDRNGQGTIFMMDADGKNAEVLIDLPGWDWYQSSWSPDGKKVAFCNTPPGIDDYAIWVTDADGANKKKLIDLPGWDVQPAWHPDGKKIVFAKWGTNEIYLIDADGKNRQKLADGWSPSWSPDGKRIAFSSDRDGNTEIYVMDADGRNVERLTYNPADDGYLHWWGAPVAVESAGKLKSTWGKIKALIRPH